MSSGKYSGFRRRLAFAVCAVLWTGSAMPAQTQKKAEQEEQAFYVCPMDAEIRSKSPGNCPKCGMALRPAAPGSRAEAAGGNALSRGTEGRADNPRIADVVVLDQNGRKLRFYTDLVKGKTVAMNFIFTTCTTICPPLTATFRSVQKSLGDRVGRDIELISISVDPAVDIPERLKSFAEKFNAGPGWTFVTGAPADIDRLLESLGAAVGNKNDHTPMVLAGNDAAHYWTRAYGLSPASKLVKVITEVADKKANNPAHGLN